MENFWEKSTLKGHETARRCLASYLGETHRGIPNGEIWNPLLPPRGARSGMDDEGANCFKCCN